MLVLPVNAFRGYAHKNLTFVNNDKSNYNCYNKQVYNADTVSFSARLPKINVFDSYAPRIKSFKDYIIPFHNPKIASRAKGFYTSDEFNRLFKFADKNGTFSLNVNPETKYITTSLIDPKENPLMSKLVWVTDSCRYMPLLKDKYPNAAVGLMENMSKFYKKQEKSFNKVIDNPLEFELNHDWPSTAKFGVGHVFNPNNLRSHKWFARTRLDSQGLYLQTMSDLITEGLNGAKYGYKSSKEISNDTIDSIANITKYLKKIIYPYAKDTGAWEERTFEITPSSDVAIINEGFRKVMKLMYEPTENKEMLKVRERLLKSSNGDVFEDKNSLKQLLEIGEYRIKTNSLEEVPYRNERKLDGAMSFIPHTEKFNENPVINASEIMKRMSSLELGMADNPELVREHGTLRYVGDKYLNMTSGHVVDNTKVRPPKTEAQWFMTSDISKSYGMAVKGLLDYMEVGGLHSEVGLKLLNKALNKQIEFINRAYARITGMKSYKANGKPCPPFQVPEAYQAVEKSNGKIVFVPGTHTPLGWAQASLYDASKLLLENLKRLETMEPDLFKAFYKEGLA